MNPQPSANPDYGAVVRFLVEPFLEAPDSLRVDCEVNPTQTRVWIRLAFDEPDKGRVYGRGGRNIQAIRTVLETMARVAGQSVHLDIYEGPTAARPRRSSHERRVSGPPDRTRTRHTPPPRFNKPEKPGRDYRQFS